MTRRLTSRQFPAAPAEWDASSKAVWTQLLRVLESSELFDAGRRTRTEFVVPVPVSVQVTVDPDTISHRELAHVVAALLVALDRSPYVDVREV